jgi:hypothetical protein
MTFFERDINVLDETDLQWLVDIAFIEGSVIEYKSQLNLETNEDIEKVLRQVSSFANARGGDLIYGIEVSKEDKATPLKVVGQLIDNADGLIQKIENIIRKNIRPQLSSFETRAIKLSNGNTAIVFRIKQSWSRPHQLRYNNKYLFYTRSSNGLAQIDVEDLRNLLVGAEDLKQRIETFRLSRIAELMAGSTPAGEIKPPIAAMHFVPLSTFEKASYDPSIFAVNKAELVPVSRWAFSTFYNFDGYVIMSNGDEGADFYVQGFRDLRFEIVLAEYTDPQDKVSPQNIDQTRLANELFLIAENVTKFYKNLNLGFPVLFMLTLLGVKDFKFRPSRRFFNDSRKPIDRDILQFPSILMDDANTEVKRFLKPTLDIFWQAAGFNRCLNYDDEGEWRD